MKMKNIARFIILVFDILLLNVGFLMAFLVRYDFTLPQRSFLPYKNSFIFLTLIYIYQRWLYSAFTRADSGRRGNIRKNSQI
jgi:hypothetical protein